MLLAHAFDTLDCIAVEFRTHRFNTQSRRAIERLGAQLDGILRAHHAPPTARCATPRSTASPRPSGRPSSRTWPGSSPGRAEDTMAKKKTFDVDDLWQIERLGAPSLAPDGAQAVATLATASMEDNKSSSALWLLSTLGGDAAPPHGLRRQGRPAALEPRRAS